MYYVYEKETLTKDLIDILTRMRTEFDLTDEQIDLIAKHAHRIILNYGAAYECVSASVYIKNEEIREKLAVELLPRALRERGAGFTTYCDSWAVSWRTDVPDGEVSDLIAELWIRCND